MRMMTLIAAGGSGIQVLEAVLHLCAAGAGPDRLRVFAIDPDSANGNLDRVRQLITLYSKCQSAFAGDGQPFFQTTLDLHIGVRIPGGQPITIRYLLSFLTFSK